MTEKPVCGVHKKGRVQGFGGRFDERVKMCVWPSAGLQDDNLPRFELKPQSRGMIVFWENHLKNIRKRSILNTIISLRIRRRQI
jgi:hypothetical protein